MINTRLLVLLAFLGALMIGGAIHIAQAQGDEPTPMWMVVDAGPSAAPAPVVEPTPEVVEADPIGYGMKLVNAVKTGDYWHALGLFMIFACIGFRRFIVKWVDWFSTDRGGVAAIGITSLLTLGGLGLVSMEVPTLKLLWSVLTATFVAMGGYAGFKRLVKG